MRRATKILLHALAPLAVVVLLVKCEPGAPGPVLSAAAERGRGVFADVCATCHNLRDPFADGLQGPAIARASRELLEAKVLRQEYPPGYKPKRDTRIMALFPWLGDRIGDLHAFLAEVPEPKG